MDDLFKHIKTALIGKTVRVQIYKKEYDEKILKLVKKSGDVTDEQLKSGLTKYTYKQLITKKLAVHKKFETFKIFDVTYEYKEQCHGDHFEFIILTLDNGMKFIYHPYNHIYDYDEQIYI